MNLEDELRRQLQRQGDAPQLTGLKPLSEVTAAAQSRATRQRAVGGLFGFAALALVTVMGMQIMSGQDSNSVVTADSTVATPTPAPEVDNAEQTLQATLDPGDAPALTIEAPTPEPPTVTLAEPSFLQTIGQVHFTGTDYVNFETFGTPSGEQGWQTNRSTDGQTWTPVTETAALDGYVMTSSVRGTKAAVIAGEPPTLMGSAGELSLALSDDLTNWTTHIIPTLDSGNESVAANGWVSDVVINDLGTLLAINYSLLPNLEGLGIDFEDTCGWYQVGTNLEVALCSGETILLPLDPALPANLDDRPQLLFTTDGTEFVEPTGVQFDDSSAGVAMTGTDTSFRVISSFNPVQFDSTDGLSFTRTPSTVGALPDGYIGDLTTRGEELLAAGGTLSPVINNPTVWLSYFSNGTWIDADLTELLGEGSQNATMTELGAGPGGFAAAATIFDFGDTGPIEPSTKTVGDYTLTMGPAGWEVAALDGSFSHTYAMMALQPEEVDDLQQGIFGGLRFFHPDTGDLVLEVPNTLFTELFGPESMTGPAILGGGGIYEVLIEGWSTTGSQLGDDITVTAPDGSVYVFDQLDTVNGDTTDGVEVTFSNAAGFPEMLQFFNPDGTILHEVLMDRIYRSATSTIEPEFPSSEFSVTEGGFTLEGTFPVGEIRLLDPSGAVLNSWDADADFDPNAEPDIIADDGASLYVFTDPATDAAVTLSIEEILGSMGPDQAEMLDGGSVPQLQSMLLFSPDGINWQILETTAGNVTSLVVGADRIVLSLDSMTGPQTMVVPIP